MQHAYNSISYPLRKGIKKLSSHGIGQNRKMQEKQTPVSKQTSNVSPVRRPKTNK